MSDCIWPNVKTVARVRRAIKEAWLIDGEKTDLDADRLALAAIAALAQSDAEPDEAAMSDYTCRRQELDAFLNSEEAHEPRPDASAGLIEENARLRAQLNEWLEWDADSDRVPCPPNETRARPDVSAGLIEAAEWRTEARRLRTFIEENGWDIPYREGLWEGEIDNKFIENIYITLKHARTFITSREKMHSYGVEEYDALLEQVDRARAAGRSGK